MGHCCLPLSMNPVAPLMVDNLKGSTSIKWAYYTDVAALVGIYGSVAT